jgi:hypothetical protein
LEAGSSKLEAWLTGSEFVLSLEPQASGLKRISALADGLMLVLQHPVKGSVSAWFSQGKKVISHMSGPHAPHAKVSFDFHLAQK